jgi:cyclohexanone monooxygenase
MNGHGTAESVRKLDVVIVGAGFAGLYALHKLRNMGLRCRVLEAGNGVGGTWFWNRYPGARCDVESVEYSFSFSQELEQEWDWTERYAAQPEILRYVNFVADRFDLRRDIQFDTRVEAAIYNERLCCWEVATDTGENFVAPVCVMATGALSSTKLPEIEGVETFAGSKFHTGRWPSEPVDLSTKRVGVIGTGSSGIQTITELAKGVRQLFVFQRTPHYTMPALNRPLTAAEIEDIKANYPKIRDRARRSTSGIAFNPIPIYAAFDVTLMEREQAYAEHWAKGRNSIVRAFTDVLVDEKANETAAKFVREKVRATVQDPVVAESLVPKHFIGTKRLCVDTGYYETFNRPNVHLVDLATNPILAITKSGVRTKSGETELDVLVFATGYDAVTGALLNIDIRTSSGRTLRQKWAAGPRCYLGLLAAGFPNLFVITGPGSPSILSNVILSIEHHVDMLAECLAHMRANGLATVDANLEAEDAWVQHVNDLAAATLYPRTASWYMGANVPGKPRVFLPYVGGVGRYQQVCRGIVSEGWRGFEFGRREEPGHRPGAIPELTSFGG